MIFSLMFILVVSFTRSRLRKEKGFFAPHVKGLTEKFKRIGNRYNVRIVFRIKHTLKGSLTKTRSKNRFRMRRSNAYSIPCECGTSYIGETANL
jgi:hypothetical protein